LEQKTSYFLRGLLLPQVLNHDNLLVMTRLLKTPGRLKKIPDWLVLIFLIVSLLGAADAIYLTVKHYDLSTIECGGSHGCEDVTSSEYSEVLGIPVSMGGALYYLIVFVSIVVYSYIKKEAIVYWVSRFTLVGFLASLYFVFLQLFIIKAICLFCMFSAGTSTILFIFGIFAMKFQRLKN
jgi:uncharacterized membrane protein